MGLDNLNDYYDPTLKDYRLSEIEKAKPAGIEYEFVKGDLADKALIDGLFEKYHFDVVVNLAAQAGVRQNCMTYPQQACASLPYMVLQVVLIWRTSGLRISCFAGRPSRFSTTATVVGTLPMSMTS